MTAPRLEHETLFGPAPATVARVGPRRRRKRVRRDVPTFAFEKLTDCRHSLVEENLGLVGKVLQMYGSKFSPLEADEKWAIGVYGLCKAAKKFRTDKGYAFSTYACASIYKTLLSESIKVGRRIKTITITKTVTYEAADPHVESERPEAFEKLGKIVRARRKKGESFADIAKSLGVKVDVARAAAKEQKA